MLIWQVTSQLINKAYYRHGTGTFNTLYMNEQADWFDQAKERKPKPWWPALEAPFNEPLKLWLEKGLIAIFACRGCSLFHFRHQQTNKPTTNNFQTFPILRTSLLQP